MGGVFPYYRGSETPGALCCDLRALRAGVLRFRVAEERNTAAGGAGLRKPHPVRGARGRRVLAWCAGPGERAGADCDPQHVLRARARILGDLGLGTDAIRSWRDYARAGTPDERSDALEAIAELEARPALGGEVDDEVAKRAIALYRDGVNLRLLGEHETAIGQLRRSYALAPHALTVVQIAAAHRGSERAVEARKATARALAIAELVQGATAVPQLPLGGASGSIRWRFILVGMSR